MENNNIKSLYLTLFILSVVNTVFSLLLITFSLGIFIDIAVLIIILIILRPKLSREKSFPGGLKLLLITSIIHFFASVLTNITSIIRNIMKYELGIHNTAHILFPLNVIILLLVIVSFVMLIISSIFIYKEYSTIT